MRYLWIAAGMIWLLTFMLTDDYGDLGIAVIFLTGAAAMEIYRG